MAALATAGAVKALVYEAVFKRAQEIAASGKLRSVAFEGEGLQKGTAQCMGSSPSDVYELSVSIDGAIAVGDCSCPAGKSAKSGLCKHAVALLVRRIPEVQGPKASPLGSLPDEPVVSIASQIDDFVTRPDAGKRADDEGEAIQSSVAKRPDPSTSSSKRALPAWMLGSAAAGPAPSSSKPKANKRAAEPKPPRPPPAKSGRRAGQPLKISNGSDDEEAEDPGEVDNAGPTEKCASPVVAVTEDAAVPERIPTERAVPEGIRTEGAAARERRRLRALKKEVVVADEEGDVEVGRTRGRSRRAAAAKAKEVTDPPVRAGNRRRLAKKYVEEDSDVSENGAVAVDVEAGDGFELTEEDMLFFAREHIEKEKEKGTGQAENVRPEEPEKLSDAEKLPQTASEGKKPPSIYSLSKWKEMSSEGGGTGATQSLAKDDLDWKTLTDYTLGANSQHAADGVLPSVQTAEPATASKDVPPLPIQTATTSSGDIDAVANNMLDILFGPSLSQLTAAKSGPAVSSTPSVAQEQKLNYSTAGVGLEAPSASFSGLPDSVTPSVLGVGNDLGQGPKPKKKSSLKDKVKMFLS